MLTEAREALKGAQDDAQAADQRSRELMGLYGWAGISPGTSRGGTKVDVTVLFPHRSVLLFFHTQCLLTWRGRRLYTNTAYLFIRTASSFCFLDLSMDLANS